MELVHVIPFTVEEGLVDTNFITPAVILAPDKDTLFPLMMVNELASELVVGK